MFGNINCTDLPFGAPNKQQQMKCLTNKTQHLSWALCQKLMSLPRDSLPSPGCTPLEMSSCFYGLNWMNSATHTNCNDWQRRAMSFLKPRPSRSCTLETSAVWFQQLKRVPIMPVLSFRFLLLFSPTVVHLELIKAIWERKTFLSPLCLSQSLFYILTHSGPKTKLIKKTEQDN